jgi:methylornithine synthase
VSDRSAIGSLCREALRGHALDEGEIRALLEADVHEAEMVYAAARAMRLRRSGDTIFLYGFVYFSTYCRNDCAFCLYRAGNPHSPRYRKSRGEVLEICRELAASGVVLIDLTMGEDPLIHGDPSCGGLLELTGAVAEETDLPLMVSPGLVPAHVLAALRAHGADWYALYQETHAPDLYARLRVGQAFEERAAARNSARAAGLLVEDGILTGAGDTSCDRARSIVEMRAAGWEQVRVMTFVPQPGTPLSETHPPREDDELLTIAAMRLAMPDRLIPASLDVAGIEGLARRLAAGADVVTSIMPPRMGLLGVSQSELGVEEGQRTAESVRRCLSMLGLRAGSVEGYRERLAALHERPVGAPT